jgi:hypothetical protein
VSAVVAWFAADTIGVAAIAGIGLWAVFGCHDAPDPGEWGPGRGRQDDYTLAV